MHFGGEGAQRIRGRRATADHRAREIDKAQSRGRLYHFRDRGRGIYARIVEEEANIKVALDPAYELARAGVQDEGKPNLGVILGLSVIFIVIIAAIVALVLYF